MPVVDASVALKWFLADEPDADLALKILGTGEMLIAPDIIVAEVCNAAWKSARLGRIAQAQVEEIAASLPRFIESFANSAMLAPRAVAIASQLDHPVYDALYLALAEREAVQVVTADTRFRSKVRGTPWQNYVVALTDYKIPA
jgi:predicted nucleic acid-binding protein